jgi:hypothetical protein
MAVRIRVRSARVVVAAAHPDAGRADLDVPPRRRSDRDERPLRRLVGRLVLGEAHVAVGAEHLGGAELLGQRAGQREHREPDGRLVDVLVRLPERLRVVELEVVVEVEGRHREALEA